MIEELREALEKIKSNYRTKLQLERMKTSELISRASIFSVEIASFAAQRSSIEGDRFLEPEIYEIFSEMADVMAKDLMMNNEELDWRLPIPLAESR